MHTKKKIIEYWDKVSEIAINKIHEDDLSRHFTKKASQYSSLVYSNRLNPVISVLERMPEARALELGAGLGVDANLMAQYANEVYAVEIESERTRIFGILSGHLENSNLKLIKRDALSWLEEIEGALSFDLIWITEAISHIHPLENLFPKLKKILSKRGRIIISESNIDNPVFRKYIDRERMERYEKKGIDPSFHKDGEIFLTPSEYEDPETGKTIQQANERMLSPKELRTMMKDFGFSHIKTDYQVFLPEKIFTKLPLASGLERICGSIPFLKKLGVRYISIFRG